MAIQVNGTEVISNSRALNNIASADATTVATLNSAGVGGGGIAYGDTQAQIVANYGHAPAHVTYDASQDKFLATDWRSSLGGSWYSTDGTGKQWVENNITNVIAYCRGGVASGQNGTFIAACNSGKIARSTNLGQSWSSVAPSYSSAGGGGGDWTSITYGNGVFIGGYRDQYIFRSTNDGVSWSQPSNPAGAGYYLNDAANDGGNNWLAVSLNRILKSTDNGATWTDLGTKTPPWGGGVSWYQIATDGNGMWVKAGQNGWVGSSTNLGSTWAYNKLSDASFTSNGRGSYGAGGFLFPSGINGGAFAQSAAGPASDFVLSAPQVTWQTKEVVFAASSTTTKAAVMNDINAYDVLVRYEA
jgi:hypothetical protein